MTSFFVNFKGPSVAENYLIPEGVPLTHFIKEYLKIHFLTKVFLVMLHNSSVNIMFLKFCGLHFNCIVVTYDLQTNLLKMRFIFCN